MAKTCPAAFLPYCFSRRGRHSAAATTSSRSTALPSTCTRVSSVVLGSAGLEADVLLAGWPALIVCCHHPPAANYCPAMLDLFGKEVKISKEATRAARITFNNPLPNARIHSRNAHTYISRARAGVVLLHRSGDAEVGVHANTPLWCPSPESHRVAVVFYLTTLDAGTAQQRRLAGQGQEGDSRDGKGQEGDDSDGKGQQGVNRADIGVDGKGERVGYVIGDGGEEISEEKDGM
jgi:hypothetical protein